jgi:hypothetical protein
MVRKSQKHRKVKRGGSGSGGNWNSATTYNSYVNGSGDSQYDRVFSTSGPYANVQGGILIGAQGQNSQLPGTPSNLALIQSAGGRKTRSRRGGFFGHILNQAIVPVVLLGLQQNYGRKKHGGTHKRRHH